MFVSVSTLSLEQGTITGERISMSHLIQLLCSNIFSPTPHMSGIVKEPDIRRPFHPNHNFPDPDPDPYPYPYPIGISGGTQRLSAQILVPVSATWSATTPAGMKNLPPAGEGVQLIHIWMMTFGCLFLDDDIWMMIYLCKVQLLLQSLCSRDETLGCVPML